MLCMNTSLLPCPALFLSWPKNIPIRHLISSTLVALRINCRHIQRLTTCGLDLVAKTTMASPILYTNCPLNSKEFRLLEPVKGQDQTLAYKFHVQPLEQCPDIRRFHTPGVIQGLRCLKTQSRMST
jgi:hypothetical protein